MKNKKYPMLSLNSFLCVTILTVKMVTKDLLILKL